VKSVEPIHLGGQSRYGLLVMRGGFGIWEPLQDMGYEEYGLRGVQLYKTHLYSNIPIVSGGSNTCVTIV